MAVKFGAHPFDNNYILRSFERAVLAAMFNDARGQGGADTGQTREFFSRGSIDVDPLFRGREDG